MPNERLGAQGYDALRNHPFFKGFDWSRPRRMRPPKLHKVQNMCSDSAVMLLLMYKLFFFFFFLRWWYQECVIISLHNPYLVSVQSDNAQSLSPEITMNCEISDVYWPLVWEYWYSHLNENKSVCIVRLYSLVLMLLVFFSLLQDSNVEGLDEEKWQTGPVDVLDAFEIDWSTSESSLPDEDTCRNCHRTSRASIPSP